MSNDYDFQPDWDAYKNMDEEERKARKELLKLFYQYNNDKISYEKYISQMDDSYFYPYLSDDTIKEIQDFNNQKKEVIEEKNIIFSNKQFKVRSKPSISYYLFILIIIISIISFFIGIITKYEN